MPKYRITTLDVDGFQMTEKRMYNTSTWPQWLKEAWRSYNLNTGSLRCGPTPKDIWLEKTSPWRTYKIEPDNFIVRYIDGNLFVYTLSAFKATYELVSEQKE